MGLTEKQRNKVMLEAGHACAICGRPHVQVHHIDGNKENADESNLIVLCANHHAEAEMSKKGRGFTAILSPDQLRLYKEKQKQELAHKGRVEKAAAGQVVLPVPPMPYFAHPYPLQKNFTGRLAERKELTEWFTKGEQPMFAYVAIGGMGKSALTWYWLQEDIVKGGLAPEGIIWWSFYDREASFDSFLRKAIQYASKGETDAKEMVSTRDGMDTLYTFLSGNRFLLVLDGVERVLRAYAGLGSPYRGDDVKEDERGDFRACIEPNVGTFLQWLASGNPKTRTLLTTRLCPRELDAIDGCCGTDLKELPKEDAVDFFHRQGVKGTRAEIESACEPFGYHSLCLRLLSGMIVSDPKYMGDVTAWTKYNPLKELKQKEHHILKLAYDSLEPQKQTLISKLSAFRNPMTYDSASIFKEFETQQEFDNALIELVDRGVLLRDTEANTYDLHPIVRKYCYDRLTAKAGVHSQLRDYFAAIPAPESIESLDDVAPVIELYHHTVSSGKYDEACGLLDERLLPRPLHYRFGAYQLATDLLRALFADGEDTPPSLLEPSKQAWALSSLGNSYCATGRLVKALPLFSANIRISRELGDKRNEAIGLGNFASLVQRPLGQFKSAESNLRRSIQLCKESASEFYEAAARHEHGLLLTYQGKLRQAEKEFAKSREYWRKSRNRQGLYQNEAARAEAALLVFDASTALKAAKEARQLAEVEKGERDIIRCEWLLGAACLAKGELRRAERYLNEALVRDRRINRADLEPDILLELAKLRFAQGRKEEALRLASEALGIADRSEYRLKQADIHNFLAEFYLNAKDSSKAKEHVEIAKERAACGYKPAMNKAEELAQRLPQDTKERNTR